MRFVSLQVAVSQIELDEILAGQQSLHVHQSFDGLIHTVIFHGDLGGKHGHAGAGGAFSEVGAGDDGVKGRDSQLRMHGIHYQHLKIALRHGMDAGFHLVADVRV